MSHGIGTFLLFCFFPIYCFVNATGAGLQLVDRGHGIDDALTVGDPLLLLLLLPAHLFRIKDGLIHVKSHADDDLDADGGKQVLVNASPVIL